ncbi:MAG TPA: hypothetical protein VK528_04180 [Flavobacterium sp.]|nr:hypothetical protein [Flavobacterium sp.]
MTIKNLFVSILFVTACHSYSQETITFKDGKQYPVTPEWNFICENYALTGTAKIQVAKTEKGGLLKLTVDATDPTFYVGGTIYVDLADNTILVCTDKGIRENSGNHMTSWYSFSVIEMNKLRKTDIASIRFYIKGNQKKFSSQTGNFTAVNKKAYFSTTELKPGKYETAAEINSLYK